jgi:hypothetical protein
MPFAFALRRFPPHLRRAFLFWLAFRFKGDFGLSTPCRFLVMSTLLAEGELTKRTPSTTSLIQVVGSRRHFP